MSAPIGLQGPTAEAQDGGDLGAPRTRMASAPFRPIGPGALPEFVKVEAKVGGLSTSTGYVDYTDFKAVMSKLLDSIFSPGAAFGRLTVYIVGEKKVGDLFGYSTAVAFDGNLPKDVIDKTLKQLGLGILKLPPPG